MGQGGIFKRLDTVIIRVSNIERARHWYEEKLGFDVIFCDEPEKLAIFDLGGDTSLTLWQLKPGESLAPTKFSGTFPIFVTDNIGEAHKTLSGLGVKVASIENGGGVTWFKLSDIDGNTLEVCQVPNS